MSLAESINTYLHKKSINKEYLADKTGISQNVLNSALNGKRRLLTDEYVKICLALKVPFDEFLPNSLKSA